MTIKPPTKNDPSQETTFDAFYPHFYPFPTHLKFKPINNKKEFGSSHIYMHQNTDTNHTIDWNAKVISKCSDAGSRKFAETCCTVSNTNSYNRSIYLPEVYLPTITDVLNNG